MSELKIIKSENKELYKALQGENKKLMRDIEFYLNQFYIKNSDYHFIKNQILKDFHVRLNDARNIWDNIGDPQEYCDSYLIGYEKKDLSICRVFINELPRIMFMFFVIMLFYGYTRRFTLNSIDSSMMEVRGIELLGALMISLIPFFTYFDNKSRVFVRSTVRTSKDLLIFISGIFAYILVGKVLNEMVILGLPKIIFIIGLGISILWMFIRRNINYKQT